jgi:hypothetical protein
MTPTQADRLIEYTMTRGYGYEWFWDKHTQRVRALTLNTATGYANLVGPLSFDDYAKVVS